MLGAQQPRFLLPSQTRQKAQFKIRNQYFEQICKSNSWAPDELRANDFKLEPPIFSACEGELPEQLNRASWAN